MRLTMPEGAVTFQPILIIGAIGAGVIWQELNLGAASAVNAAITRDPVSQVVLRGTEATRSSYGNGSPPVFDYGV